MPCNMSVLNVVSCSGYMLLGGNAWQYECVLKVVVSCSGNMLLGGNAWQYECVLKVVVSCSGNMVLGGNACARCGTGFGKDEEMVNSSGQVWHVHCFV